MADGVVVSALVCTLKSLQVLLIVAEQTVTTVVPVVVPPVTARVAPEILAVATLESVLEET